MTSAREVANRSSTSPVIGRILDHARSSGRTSLEDVVFASDPDANRLVKDDLFAFLLAASIDRGGKSFKIFNTPLRLLQRWGHLDLYQIAKMDAAELSESDEIRQVPSTMSRLHIAKSIVSVAELVVSRYAGDPNGFFVGDVDEIRANLEEIFGVGPGIARMIIIQRLLYFGLVPPPGGRLLPKQDVHINRVFERTGLTTTATETDMRRALRDCTNTDVALIDQVAWNVGINFCRSRDPLCGDCPITDVCPRSGLAAG